MKMSAVAVDGVNNVKLEFEACNQPELNSVVVSYRSANIYVL
jgi:hypothetical protein